jgi:hypothetical protein
MEANHISICSSRKELLPRRRQAIVAWLFLALALVSPAIAQTPLPTSRGDTRRSGANTNETILTPSNVNATSFGSLFSVPIDYQSLAQPLYVPSVKIGGQTHNVIYVVTQADTVYAIDADNGSVLWTASMLDGGTVASGGYLPCGTLGGFAEEGIVGTPVIDQSSGTMYLVAKTVVNATVQHNLHLLDVTTGLDKVSPVQIAGTSKSLKGTTMVFNSLHQKNRPGLLLMNGTLYMGFGSNGCNDHNSGWVLAYDVSNQHNIQQTGVFNTSPDIGLVSIWQTGNGLAADDEGNVYVSTAESGNYDVPSGGQSFSNSILKLSPAPWTSAASQPQLADYFTPASVAYLNAHDLDVSSVGPLVVPDLTGPYPHELLTSSKEGIVWVLDRDAMGWYSAGGDNIIQEFGLSTNGELMCSPAYWNGTAYFLPDGSPIQAFQVANGLWTLSAQTVKRYNGASSPAISANGNTNGIVWEISGTLNAFDAVTLKLLYTSPTKLPKIAHFATPTVANGKVYIATQTTLEAYGLLNALSVASGNSQTAQAGQALPLPLKIVATNYTGQPQTGITVSFSDGGSGGSFNPPSAITNSAGTASSVYTLPAAAGTYTLTASAPNFGSVTATETATSATVATKLVIISGTHQTGPEGSVLPLPLVVEVQDAKKNPVSGATVQFKAVTQGTVSPTSAVTNAGGLAQTSFQLPMASGTFNVSVSTAGAKNVSFSETAEAGTATTIAVASGNNQNQAVKTTLKNALTVLVTDQYGSPVANVAVTFSDNGAGGSFSNLNPVYTDSTGTTWQAYTLPATAGTIKITATAAGIATPATFTEIAY